MNEKTALSVTNFSVDIANLCTKLVNELSMQDHDAINDVKLILGKILGETYFLALPAWEKFPELKPKEISLN
jgi:hypothetical protein